MSQCDLWLGACQRHDERFAVVSHSFSSLLGFRMWHVSIPNLVDLSISISHHGAQGLFAAPMLDDARASVEQAFQRMSVNSSWHLGVYILQ